MHLFADYIAPFTHWLQQHPHIALLITFLFSFSESLAIVGSIIPGSLTMTAIGILAGSGVMRIDFTLLAATLGAIAGDGVSYWLGYAYRDKISGWWPFYKYPHWLEYGKEYFSRHGGKSVLIGRFFGPLRSIIPLIAGMLNMGRLRFFLANSVSAVGWSLLYVMPGVLIGVASNELSTENATRLCLLSLGLIALIWFSSLSVRWLLQQSNRLLDYSLNQFWCWAKRHPNLHRFFQAITPPTETSHYITALLLVSIILFIILLILLSVATLHKSLHDSVNFPVYYFLQSIRTAPIDSFMACIIQFSSPITNYSVFLITIVLLQKDKFYSTTWYWISMILTTFITCYFLNHFIVSTRPQGILWVIASNPFADFNLALNSALFAFLLFFTSHIKREILPFYLKIVTATTLFLNGLALVYLGDFWLSDLLVGYLIGFIIALLHWLNHRAKHTHKQVHVSFLIVLMVTVILSMSISSYFNFKPTYFRHLQFHTQHVISEQEWWSHDYNELPIYRKNRLGHPINLLNLQYSGDIEFLKQALMDSGWVELDDSFLQLLIQKFNHPPYFHPLPLFRQLYNNQIPVLSMVRMNEINNENLILHFWPSNYHLIQPNQVIWIGSVHNQNIKGSKKAIIPLMKKSLKHFQLRTISLNHPLKPLEFPVEGKILLIKEH